MEAVWQDQAATVRTSGSAEARAADLTVPQIVTASSAQITAQVITAGAQQTVVAEFDRVRAQVMRGRVFDTDSADLVRDVREERANQI